MTPPEKKQKKIPSEGTPKPPNTPHSSGAKDLPSFQKPIRLSGKRAAHSPHELMKLLDIPRIQESCRLQKVAALTKQFHPAIPSDSPIRHAHEQRRQMVVLLAKNHHKQLADAEVGKPLPAAARSSEKMLQKTLSDLFSAVPDFDEFMTHMYQSHELNIEQKAILRETVVRLFSLNAGIDKNNTDNTYIIDVFAIPVFGHPQSVRTLLDDSHSMRRLCGILTSSGYISGESDKVALLNVALHSNAVILPSVLHALSNMWGELVAHTDAITQNNAHEIRRMVQSILQPYEVKSNTGATGFVIPGIRVWRSPNADVRRPQEILNNWTATTAIVRASQQLCWNAMCTNVLRHTNIPAGSLLIRPPAPVLVAHAQALAWHITQQMYERLNGTSFEEINFVSANNDNTVLALRAYDHRQKLVAQSDPVDLFDVIAAADDFSDLIHQECRAHGPRSQCRDIAR